MWMEAQTIQTEKDDTQSPKPHQRRTLSVANSNVSTTPITAMGCGQCLPLSVVQLKGKHCRKPNCHNVVVDNIRSD